MQKPEAAVSANRKAQRIAVRLYSIAIKRTDGAFICCPA
jgi:hypothetical protein